MPEPGEDAAILIATSYQTLKRIDQGIQGILITDCTIVILLAGSYIEATQNHIIENTRDMKEILAFPCSKNNSKRNRPSMKYKLAWFDNAFVEESPFSNWKNIHRREIDQKMKERFPGFDDRRRFRNDLTHSKINRAAKSFQTAQKLRQTSQESGSRTFQNHILNGVFSTPTHNV